MRPKGSSLPLKQTIPPPEFGIGASPVVAYSHFRGQGPHFSPLGGPEEKDFVPCPNFDVEMTDDSISRGCEKNPAVENRGTVVSNVAVLGLDSIQSSSLGEGHSGQGMMLVDRGL